MQVKKQKIEAHMKQLTGSKLEKEYDKAVYCHPAYLTYVQSARVPAQSLQSCPTLWDPMDGNLLGFSIHGILQARILEWIAISFSRGSSRPRDWTRVSGIGGRHFNLWATREAWEIKPVNPKGNQSWKFIGRIDVEGEAPILWPPDVKSWLIRKDPDTGKNWRQEKKGTTDEMVGWRHHLKGHEFEQAPGVGDKQGNLACCSPWGSQRVRYGWATELNWKNQDNIREIRREKISHYE